MKPKTPTPNLELGPMHNSSPNGCRDDCEACARESRFAAAARRALSLLDKRQPREAAPLLWEAHDNAPTTDARARITGALRELRAGNLDAAEIRLAEAIEVACFD